jgi:hypothetical protein
MITRFLLILVTWLGLPSLMAAAPEIAVVSPRPGEALQGVVTITGSAAVDGFAAMELSFAYSHDPGRTWFLIQESLQPVSSGALAAWDTTTITDGDYDLRLLVILKDGTKKMVVVAGLRVRNYTPVETNTPTATKPAPAATPEPTRFPENAVLSATPQNGVRSATPEDGVRSATPSITAVPPTATTLPTNPARLSQVDYAVSLTQGVAIVLVLFAALGLYLGIRRLKRR